MAGHTIDGITELQSRMRSIPNPSLTADPTAATKDAIYVNAIYVDLADSAAADSKSSNGSSAASSSPSSPPTAAPTAPAAGAGPSSGAAFDVKRILDDVIENVTGVKREEQPPAEQHEQQQQQQLVRSHWKYRD